MPSLDFNLGLKDSLASLTRWLPMPVTTHFAKLVDWALEKEKLTILERSSSELDDELELESEVELSELDELGLDMLTALELKKIWRRKLLPPFGQCWKYAKYKVDTQFMSNVVYK